MGSEIHSRVSLYSAANRMWLAQFVFAPQFFRTPSGLCGHTVCLLASFVISGV
jgi:hypothetical protein